MLSIRVNKKIKNKIVATKIGETVERKRIFKC